jgi:ribosomal protein S18 acetylase RimI-like enzyme
MKYEELVQAIVDLALEGSPPGPLERNLPFKSVAGEEGGKLVEVALRPMRLEDVAALVEITRDTGFFRLDEVVTAQELLEECAAKGESSGYYVQVATEGSGKPLGYVCFGPTPLTLGTWDVYWIAVAPGYQGLGIGTRLMRWAEGEICQRGGRLVLVETSSQELYASTRRFYCSSGYEEVSRIPDFYDLGDAKVTFAKVISQGGR